MTTLKDTYLKKFVSYFIKYVKEGHPALYNDKNLFKSMLECFKISWSTGYDTSIEIINEKLNEELIERKNFIKSILDYDKHIN